MERSEKSSFLKAILSKRPLYNRRLNAKNENFFQQNDKKIVYPRRYNLTSVTKITIIIRYIVFGRKKSETQQEAFITWAKRNRQY